MYVVSPVLVTPSPSCLTSDIIQSSAYVGGGTVWSSLKHLCPQTELATGKVRMASSQGIGYL